MNKKVFLLAFFLISLSAGITVFKVIHGERSFSPDYTSDIWRVRLVMILQGEGGRAKVRVTLPKEDSHQRIYNEHFENEELVFYLRERPLTGNRIGFWRSELLDSEKTIGYQFSTQLKAIHYRIPQEASYKFMKRLKGSPLNPWLRPALGIQVKDEKIQKLAHKLTRGADDYEKIFRRLFSFIRGEVKYKSEKGSKDAKETLDELVADCGGQARLFCALSRAAGIPSRVVGGLILEKKVKKTTHVWVENWVKGEWIPFDVVNNYFGLLPSHYLILYRGDYPLFRYVGFSRLDYYFAIDHERIPPVDDKWSLYSLPLYFQKTIKVLLLIPVGALCVTLFRVVIGVPTFGTFAPVLLALAFREMSLTLGVSYLVAIVFIGWIFRKVLDALKVLLIPRLAFILTFIVSVILTTMVLGYHLGIRRVLFVSLYPMVIITWMVERFSILQIEDGTKEALKAAFGTLIVSMSAYFVFNRNDLRTYLFSFPEVLLAIMGIMILLGRYAGFRLLELWRFREFLKPRSLVKDNDKVEKGTG